MNDTVGSNGAVRSALHDHWKLFLAEGTVLLILGSAAIVVPAAASLAMAIVLGWIFVVGGGVGLLTTRNRRGFREGSELC